MRRNVTLRLSLLFAGLLVLGTLAGGFYVFRQRQIRSRYIALRQDGIAAANAGKNEQAVDLLEHYLQRYPDDGYPNSDNVDALVIYAKVRPLVELPKNAQIGNTIVALRRLLRLKPKLVEPRRSLLALYVKSGFLTEAEDTANLLHDLNADDAEVLQLKSAAQMGLQEFSAATKTTDQWVAMSPQDISAWLTKLWLMHKLNRLPKEILQTAEVALKEPPDDPRVQLIRGFAYALTDDREDAASSLRAASTATPTDTTFARLLCEQLDDMELFDESLSVLERAFAATQDSGQRDQLLRRYWELGRSADVVKLMDARRANDPKTNSDLVALYGLSLHELKRDGEVTTVLNSLASRKDDSVAAAWRFILQQVIDNKGPDAQQLFDTCQAALRSQPNDAYLGYFEGEAYARLNENDLAVQVWQKCAESNRTWAVPVLRLAQTLGEAGRHELAFQAAVESYRRSKHAPEAIVWARVWAICIENGLHNQPDQLLELVSEIQKQFPQEEQSLAIRAGLLGEMKKFDDARKVLTDALATKSDFSEELLLHLAALSQHYNLKMENLFYDRSEQKHGTTAELAYARAGREFMNTHPAEGLKIFESSRAKAKDSNSIMWQFEWARYLDVINDPRAKAAVIALGNTFVDDIRVQRLALAANSPRTDQAFMEKSFNRMQKLTGDKGVAWRLARARWLLDFTKPPAENREAITLLTDVTRLSPDLVDARVLLARAFERDRKLSDAVEQLNIAVKLNPTANSIGLYLARLLQQRGDFERAREQLEQVADRTSLNATERRQAAWLLSEQGEPQQAIDQMEEANRESTEQGTEDLLLAELYRQRNQPDKAEAICRKLLEKLNPSVPNPEIIEFAADLFAGLGRKDEAAKILARLDGMKLDPGVKETTLANYAARHVGTDTALKLYRSATIVAPKQINTWRALITACVATGDVEQALSVNQQAMAQLPEDPGLQAIARQAPLLRSSVSSPALNGFALSFVRDPGDDSPMQALQLILASKNDASVHQALPRLAELANRYPRMLPLQTYLASAYVRVGQLDDAIAAANRAAQVAPNSPDAFILLFDALQVTGRWQEALDAAKKWRERSISNPLQADVAIAMAQIGLNQPEAAITQLQPYMNDPKSPAYEAARITYAQAEAATATSGSASIMEPLLNQGPRGRETWMVFAVDNLDDTRASIWLDRVTPLVPADAEEEHIVLSEAWGQVFQRSGSKHASEQSRAALAPPIAKNPSPALMMAMGIREEQDGNLDIAESWYRQVVAHDGIPSQLSLSARNNLAMVLATRNKLPEANEVATSLVKTHPDIAPFFDTLAFVQSRQKQYDQALANMNIAIRLQPRNPTYRLNKAQALMDGGHREEVKQALSEFDALHTDLTKLSMAKRQQLKSLRDGLSATAHSRSHPNSSYFATASLSNPLSNISASGVSPGRADSTRPWNFAQPSGAFN